MLIRGKKGDYMLGMGTKPQETYWLREGDWDYTLRKKSSYEYALLLNMHTY